MVTPVITYREASRQLLAQARAELDAGDLRQASEKAWGAAAQIVKAAAELRGWDHYSHRGILLAVGKLADEAGDEDIHSLFAFSIGLHANIELDVFSAESVSRYLALTEKFIAKIEAILDTPPAL